MSSGCCRLRSLAGALLVLLVCCNLVAAQGTSGARRPLPAQIRDMPQISAELDVIERRSQLIRVHDNIARIFIADPSIIDFVQFNPREFSLIGLARGSTTMALWFDDSDVPLIYLVRTIRDPSLEDLRRIDYGNLERELAKQFPNSRVTLTPLSGKIIVRGQARDAGEAAHILNIIRGEVINQEGGLGGPQQAVVDPVTGAPVPFGRGDRISSLIVNLLEVPGEYQVMVRVRIAQLNRSQLQRQGVDLNVLLNSGRHALGATVGGLAPTLSGIFENGEIQVFLDWLETNGTAKILSEPALTVMSGDTASFIAGVEFAVPTIIGIGGGQQTTFRGTGTSIVVTPTVVDRDLIRMRIIPEFSQIDPNSAVQGIPGTNTRRATTTVELREGQTIAIAGLISHQMSTEITRIPFLGEIPYIGPRLFNAKRATQDETELLILVTPELVRPMDAEEVPPVPGFEVTPPNSWDLYKYARTEGTPDLQYYQLSPAFSGTGHGVPVPFGQYNPAPASPLYSPVPTDPYGADGANGYSPPAGYGPQGPPPAGYGLPPQGPPPAPPSGQPYIPPAPRDWQQPGHLEPAPDPSMYGPAPRPGLPPRPGPTATRPGGDGEPQRTGGPRFSGPPPGHSSSQRIVPTGHSGW